MTRFATWLKAARESKGLTQAQLAAQVGVTQPTASTWERGAVPRPTHMKRLAAALDADPVDLLHLLDG